jgi:hypothetical protein
MTEFHKFTLQARGLSKDATFEDGHCRVAADENSHVGFFTTKTQAVKYLEQ